MTDDTPTCPTCGLPVSRRSKYGPDRRYCSDRCRARASSLVSLVRLKVKRDAARLERRCVDCGIPLVGSSLKLCDVDRAERKRRTSRDSRTRICSDGECVRPVRAVDLCNMHYKRKLRAEGRMNEPWSDRRRNNAQARRARMKGARTGGSVFLTDIITRDGTDCWLCGLPVDMTLAWPDRNSKSVDHVIPLSKGGIHDPSNCALAHMGCNAAKGDRVA